VIHFWYSVFKKLTFLLVKMFNCLLSTPHSTGCVQIIRGFCRTIFSQILNRNTWCYYHLKEECFQFHSDLKCIRCAPLMWHGRCPGNTPIPAKPSQACLVWCSWLRWWCALAILVVSLEVVGRKHPNIPLSNGSNIMYFRMEASWNACNVIWY